MPMIEEDVDRIGDMGSNYWAAGFVFGEWIRVSRSTIPSPWFRVSRRGDAPDARHSMR